MNTIKHVISRFVLPVLLLVSMASCSVNYGYRRPYYRPHPHYGYGRPVPPPPARSGWYGRW